MTNQNNKDFLTNQNNKNFCINFVNDVKDPEKFPHSDKQYKQMCNLFETLYCKEFYVSDEDSELVNELCSHSHTNFHGDSHTNFYNYDEL